MKKEKNFSRPTQPSNNKKEKKRGLKKAFFCRPSAGPLTDGGEQDKFFGTGNRRNKKRINWIFTFFLIETLPPAGSRYFLTPPSCQNGRTEGNGNGKIGRKSTARPCPHKMAENGKKNKGGGDLAAFFFFLKVGKRSSCSVRLDSSRGGGSWGKLGVVSFGFVLRFFLFCFSLLGKGGSDGE